MNLSKSEAERIIIETLPTEKTEAIYIFGSYNTEFFNEDSDIDIGWFSKDTVPYDYIKLEEELESKLGREIDLINPDTSASMNTLILSNILSGTPIGEMTEEFSVWFDRNYYTIVDEAETFKRYDEEQWEIDE